MFEGNVCADNLITGQHGVADDKLTASSVYEDQYEVYYPSKSRITSSSSWAAGILNTQQYIQVHVLKEDGYNFLFHLAILNN